MSLVNYAINNRAVCLVLIFLISAGGFLSYGKLGKLEDPDFTIKEAVIYTVYPGATAEEVEQEITEPIETAVQQLKQLNEVRSISRAGVSIVRAEMQDLYDKDSLPQVWDELRRKVSEVSSSLPPGSYAPYINDDFGDVYGVFFAVTGDGYDQRQLQEVTEDLRKELLLCKGVGRIAFWGFQQEAVYLEIDRDKLSRMGLSPVTIISTIQQQNSVTDAGKVKVGSNDILLRVSGDYEAVRDIGKQLVQGSPEGSLIRIEDIATITRGYVEPETEILRRNGEIAVGLGISTVSGGNVVKMGEAVKEKLAELEPRIPVGVNVEVISFQSETVDKAVNGFVLNLFEAVAIVVLLLVIFMGWREGVIIGSVLLLTILATFSAMLILDVSLQRISLGALIIALGMLVDNAIVVAEGYAIKTRRGVEEKTAAIQTVKETQWPLLGATIIAILAFAAISLSKDVTGEFLGSLFQVIGVSLLLSWVLAVTIVPYLCVTFLSSSGNAETDVYDNPLFRGYRSFLKMCISHRWLTILIVIGFLGAAIYGFGFVKQNFFPNSPRPQFMVSVFLPEGKHIDETDAELRKISSYLESLDEVTDINTFVGGGALRFILTYSPEMPSSNYGQLLVSVKDFNDMKDLVPEFRKYLDLHHPNIIHNVETFKLGPGGAAVEVRFKGPDANVLRELGDATKAVMWNNDNTATVRTNWGERVLVASVDMANERANRIGISRSDIASSLGMNFSGATAGQYREGDDLLPIIIRPPKEQREGINNLEDVQVWSSATQTAIPIEQVVNATSAYWEDPVIHRLNRMRTITVSCIQKEGTANSLFTELRSDIEKIPLPQGYSLEWGGEYESSNEANQKLLSKVPIAFAVMFLISVMLFNTLRHPIIIFLGLPLALIGVSGGLLIADKPFGFMSLLGFLSLSGMLMKNEIVLLDQINIELDSGKQKLEAVLDAAVSRVRPVSLAAFTTVLGMVPLLWDAFFDAMAVTIMGGLTFATVLTLIVVPVLYCTFFGVYEFKDLRD